MGCIAADHAAARIVDLEFTGVVAEVAIVDPDDELATHGGAEGCAVPALGGWLRRV
jgi:hypothetical protein